MEAGPGPAAEAVARLLSTGLGAAVGIDEIEPLGPWAVQRCRLAPARGAPASVIVKWLRSSPAGSRTDPRRIATEQAALTFLGAIGFAKAPRLIASDLEAGLLALEDLAPREPLADLLRRGPAAALETERLAFAETMGALAAATVRNEGDYLKLRARLGPPDPSVGREGGLGPSWAGACAQLDALGQPMPAQAQSDIAAVLEALAEPGPFLAFSNGDPEANNFMVSGGDGCVIDFEAAGFRHALTCATWIWTPGPAWMAVNDPIAGRLEIVFRSALATGVREAQDDRAFGFGMAAACLALALERLGRFAILDARRVGDPSRAQMVSTLASAVAVARRHGALGGLAGWTESVAAWLRVRWPDADVDVEAYAPYTPRPSA